MLPKNVGLQLLLSDGCRRCRDAKGAPWMMTSLLSGYLGNNFDQTKCVSMRARHGHTIFFTDDACRPRGSHNQTYARRTDFLRFVCPKPLSNQSLPRRTCFRICCIYVATSIYDAHMQAGPRKNPAIFAIVISPDVVESDDTIWCVRVHDEES